MNKVSPQVKARQQIERAIVSRVVEDILAAGYFLNVENGGDEPELFYNTHIAADVLRVMFATDDEYLTVHKIIKGTDRVRRVGWVHFVYGNDGWDVINDYTVNLESVLEPTMELAESLS